MKRRRFLQWNLGLGLGLPGVGNASVLRGLHWDQRVFTGLGTTLQLRAAHANAAQVAAALDAAVQEVRALEDVLSLFRPHSAVCTLNRDGVLHQPPAALREVLQTAHRVAQRSGGAFDITVQPLWELFEAARVRGSMPSASEVAAARDKVGWQRVHIDADAQRITLAPGTALTLNGIAQGYVADRVRARLQQFGIAHALVNTGEWAALGQPELGRDWTLGLAHPRQDADAPHALREEALLGRLALQGLCMATSADDPCSFSPDHRHHHIFNPHTGYSPPDIASVTVLASRCVLADALTKVLFMAGFDRALIEAQRWGVQALIVSKRGELRVTPGLRLFRA